MYVEKMWTPARRDWTMVAVGTLALVGYALFMPTGPKEVAAENSIPFRIAYFPNLTHAVALAGQANGEFSKNMPGYNVQPKVVNAGPEAMEALLAGELDASYVGPSPAINTYVKSEGKALTIIAGACSGGASLIAAENSGITKLADLGGKTVAIPQLGGTQDVSARYWLAQNGLTPQEKGGTVKVLPLKNPDILTLFKQGKLDSAWVPEPWATRLRLEAGGKTVVDERDLWPNRQFTTTVLVVATDFAKKHPEAVRGLLIAHQKTLAWIRSHPKEAPEVVNGELKRLTGKPLGPQVLKEAWANVDLVGDPGEASVQRQAEAAVAAGYLKELPSNFPGIFKR